MRFHQPLDQVLNSDAKVRILRFLCRRGGQWNGRRLAAALRMNPTTVHKALREMHDTTVLDFQRVGNNCVYALADEHYLVREILRPAFAREGRVLEAVTTLLRGTLGSALHRTVVAAAIYGSVARRQERPTSDVDVLILVKESQAKRRVQTALGGQWEVFARQLGSPLAPYVSTVREARQKYRRGTGLFRDILASHHMLWGPSLEDIVRGRAA